MSDFVPDEVITQALDVLGTVGTTTANAAGTALAQGIARWMTSRISRRPDENSGQNSDQNLPDAEQLRELIRTVLAEQPELRREIAQSVSSVQVSAIGNDSVAVNTVGGDMTVTNRRRTFWARRRD
ncbi:hypothetical protein [Nocardia sp. NPDC004722]